MISHFPVGRFGTMKERFFLTHNQIGTPSAICFAWDKLCLPDDLDYTPMQHVIPHVSSFLLSSPMKIAHVDPYVPNVSVKKQKKRLWMVEKDEIPVGNHG